MKKHVPEYFHTDAGHKAKAEVLGLAEKLCCDREEQYIVKNSNEYEQPHFDIPVDANLHDWNAETTLQEGSRVAWQGQNNCHRSLYSFELKTVTDRPTI